MGKVYVYQDEVLTRLLQVFRAQTRRGLLHEYGKVW